MKKIASLIIGLLIVNLFTFTTNAKQKSPISVECNDTIAGYNSDIEISTLKNTDLNLLLKTPTGKKIYIQETSDKNGDLIYSITDYHLNTAGQYSISAKFTERNEDFGQQCNFTVYPGELNASKSSINVDRKTAEIGYFENIITQIHLTDTFGNPIKGHSVELISSKIEDNIQLLSKLPYTDDNGDISFLINSEVAGITTLSALDTTDDTMLDARLKVAFIEKETLNPIGGEDEYSLLDKNNSSYEDGSIFLASTENIGGIYELEVSINNEAQTNEVTSTTITAIDELGNIIPNYTGTIRFSSTDDNASLPEDYQFTSDDLGSHNFDLGLTFKSEGTQIISVNDISNFNIKGEAEINITPSETTVEPIINTKTTLTTPKAGTTNSSTIKISGQTDPNQNIQIYDNEFIAQEITSNEVGNFNTELTNIVDGEHIIHVITIDDENNTTSESEKIIVQVDTTKPSIGSFTLTPNEAVESGSEVTANLISESGLIKASILIEDQIIEMIESIDTPGSYKAVFVAPANAENYEVDLVLQDLVGNQATFKNQINLIVIEKEEEQEEIITPSKITEITMKEEDSKIVLTWAAAEDDTYISKYKISYGSAPNSLLTDVETFDSSTTWYIPNLTNEAPYYFVIAGVDSEGNIGESSEVKLAIPHAPEPEFAASLEDEIILEELPKKTPETGPALWFMIISSLLLVDIFYRKNTTNKKTF